VKRIIDLSMPVHMDMLTFPRVPPPALTVYESHEDFATRIHFHRKHRAVPSGVVELLDRALERTLEPFHLVREDLRKADEERRVDAPLDEIVDDFLQTRHQRQHRGTRFDELQQCGGIAFRGNFKRRTRMASPPHSAAAARVSARIACLTAP